MTDDVAELTPDDKLREQAREAVQTPAEPIPDAGDLPDDVRSDRIQDDGEGS